MLGFPLEAKKRGGSGTHQVPAKTSARTGSTKVKPAKVRSGGSRRGHGGRTQQAGTASRTPPVIRQQSPSSDRYREIQQALADKGYYEGPVTGVWDSASVDALRRFQQDQNLKPDGKLGSLSLIALGLGPKREATLELPPATNAFRTDQ